VPAPTALVKWISKVRDISWALQNDGKPFPWAIEGLTVRTSASVTSGLPHGMKSFNWLAGCMELAYQQTLWGKFRAPAIQRTLFIESEDSELVLNARICGLLRGFGIRNLAEIPNFHYLRTGPFDLVAAQKDLKSLIAQVKPDFVVLSTLQGLLAGRDWNVQSEMAGVNKLVVEIGDMLPCGLMVITHSPQSHDAKRPAGTVTQLANYSTAIHFEKTRVGINVRVDSKFGSEHTNFCLNIETGERPGGHGGEKEVRRVNFTDDKPVAKKEIIAAVFKENGLDANINEVVDIVTARLGNGETVSGRHVNKVRNEMRREMKGSPEAFFGQGKNATVLKQ
jgi:hypothetical protein